VSVFFPALRSVLSALKAHSRSNAVHNVMNSTNGDSGPGIVKNAPLTAELENWLQRQRSSEARAFKLANHYTEKWFEYCACFCVVEVKLLYFTKCCVNREKRGRKRKWLE
jgi:hypothetical protein